MSELDTQTKVKPVIAKSKNSIWRYLWLIPLVLIAIFLVFAVWIDTASGHRFIVKQINQASTESGLGFTVDRIEGSVYNDLRVNKLTLNDLKGEFFSANDIDIQWFPLGYLGGRLSIDKLHMKQGQLDRLPNLKDSDDDGPKLPDFDIFIGDLSAPTIILGPDIIKRSDSISINGNADIQSGRARVKFLLTSLSGNDMADIDIDVEADQDKFKIAAQIDAPENGFIQTFTGIKWADTISVSGRGSWVQWQGKLNASLQGIDNIALNLQAQNGDYTVDGNINSVALPRGVLRNISVPVLSIDLNGTYDKNILRLTGDATSQNALLKLDGGYDFALGGLDAFLVDFDLIKAGSIARNLTGDAIQGRSRLDGPLSNLKIEYLVNADALGLGAIQIENVNAKGVGRRVGRQVTMPVNMQASNAIGLPPQILELLGDIEGEGIAQLSGPSLIMSGAQVKTNRLNGILDVDANLRARQYDIVFDGKLPSYLLEGIGLADIEGRLNFNPAQPKGIQITGKANAQLRRMDNSFLRDLSGGLPNVVTDISLGPDAIFRFVNFTVDAPLLNFQGAGRRERGGTYIINGIGNHDQYGDARVGLTGDLSRPNITLNLDRPLDTLGLRDVAITLTPNDNGFAFNSTGTSLLGPFVSNGDILLSPNSDAAARFDRLLVSDTIARGNIRNSADGFVGDFTINQGGVEGAINLRPAGDAQRVVADLNIKNARFRGDDTILIRSGKFNLTALFEDAASDVDATLQAQGISRGNLILGRVAANAKIKNGSGIVNASIAGTRGSGFDIATNIAVSPNRYVVKASGNYRRRPIRLTRDAIISRRNNIWSLGPTRLTYGGGQLSASGRYGTQVFEVDAIMKKLPLDLLDLGDSNLGFGGVASGNIQYSNNGASHRGQAKLNIKGLTRSGLLLSSRPIDAALNMKLSPASLATRAILSSGGDNVGRLQSKIELTNNSDIMRKISRGKLFAQARFDGQADTLWRLTGIELFDLTGDAKIAVDASGSLLNPKIKGAIQTKKARLESSISGTVIDNVSALGRFNGSRLQIVKMDGNTSQGGAIKGSGYFDFSTSNAIGINLNIDAKSALLINRDDVAARVTGPIQIISDGVSGTISGDVVMNQGRYQLGRANAEEILPDVNVREINVRDDLPFTNRAFTPWNLDVAVKSRNRFDVTGLGINSEWSGDFKIGGRIDRPTVGGRANLVRGEYDFAGRVFRLARGSIAFDRRNPPNPQIDIVAEALLNGVDARIEVRGRSLSPEITFASTPPLPQEELLARLLFGSSILELSPAEAIQLSSALAGLQNGGLDPINAIRKAVGLDRLRLVSANAATGRGTGIAVGKFIGRRTFVELVTDGRGYNATQVEFQVTRWLALLSSISTIGEQGVNARISRDY